MPTGHATNDVLLLYIESANELGTCPSGYTQVGPQFGTGTAAASGATRLTTCWKRDGGSESAPTVADSGDHTYAVLCAFSGVVTTGDPFHFLGGGVKATASTSASAAADPTTVDDAFVVVAFAQAVSSASGQYSAEANTNLGSVTEQFDAGTTSGVGGGLMVTTGTKVTAGTIGATTATVGSSAEAFMTLALLPTGSVQPGITPRACDVQTFTACGNSAGCPADTWVKPTGAKTVDIIAIGGGGRGGQGIVTTAAGGGGGGGGAYSRKIVRADQVQATMTVTVGVGGLGGSTKTSSGTSTVVDNSKTIVSAAGGSGSAAGDAASNSGGNGQQGGSVGSLVSPATAASPGTQSSGGLGGGPGTGGTTGGIGGKAEMGGGGGGGGKNATGAGAGGTSEYAGGGGGGGASTGTAGAGGVGGQGAAGGTSQGGSATSTGIMTLGGSGGAGGAQTTQTGGNGAQPGGGGGGGGNLTNSGGNGADGAVTIITCF